MQQSKEPQRKSDHSELTLLGNSRTGFPTSPEHAKLETFLNPYKSRNYSITIDAQDFTSLCPVTGQPDFAKISIQYVADARCVETKSLKLYLASYRNVPSFNENVVNRIADDLIRALKPRQMRVEGSFVSRGGLALSVVVEHPNPTLHSKRKR